VSFAVILSRQARRALANDLPEAVTAACLEFIHGPLAENPYRVGKRLREPASEYFAARRGDFRVIYKIEEHQVLVRVANVRHRRDAYRNLS
jgi:mRNA interferase RelE/StbE